MLICSYCMNCWAHNTHYTSETPSWELSGKLIWVYIYTYSYYITDVGMNTLLHYTVRLTVPQCMNTLLYYTVCLTVPQCMNTLLYYTVCLAVPQSMNTFLYYTVRLTVPQCMNTLLYYIVCLTVPQLYSVHSSHAAKNTREPCWNHHSGEYVLVQTHTHRCMHVRTHTHTHTHTSVCAHTHTSRYLGKYLPIGPSAMVTTANGLPAERDKKENYIIR